MFDNMGDRDKKGITGIAFIVLAGSYLYAYHNWGVEGYIYWGVGLTASIGLLNLLAAAFLD